MNTKTDTDSAKAGTYNGRYVPSAIHPHGTYSTLRYAPMEPKYFPTKTDSDSISELTTEGN